jgi:hypothetical protein
MQKHVVSGGRYPVLRAIALLYLIGAGVAILGGIVGCIWILTRAPLASWGDRTMMCLSTLAAAFFVCIGSLAVAEVLKLFMDVEHNTRMTAVAVAPVSASLVGPDVPRSSSVSAGNEPVIAGAAHAVSSDSAHQNRMTAHILDEETAEGALLRGR